MPPAVLSLSPAALCLGPLAAACPSACVWESPPFVRGIWRTHREVTGLIQGKSGGLCCFLWVFFLFVVFGFFFLRWCGWKSEALSFKLFCMSAGALKMDHFPLLVLEGLLFSLCSVHYTVDMFYIQPPALGEWTSPFFPPHTNQTTAMRCSFADRFLLCTDGSWIFKPFALRLDCSCLDLPPFSLLLN